MLEIYEDEDEYPVYVFYYEDKLYAWTTQKKLKDSFEKQRNMKVFRRKKRVLSPIHFHAFSQKYKQCQLIEIPLRSKGKNLSIYGTYFEDDELSNFSELLLCTFEKLEIYFGSLFHNHYLPKKYDEAIELLLDYYTINDKTKINEFAIDSLSMFYTLFKHTF